MKLKIVLPLAAGFLVLAAFTFEKIAAPQGRCTACDTLTGLEKVVCLANEFKSSLSASQQTTLEQSYTLANAQKWSNLPVGLASRIGIRFGDLTADQLAKAKAVVEAMTGTTTGEGYDEAQQLWAADKYLGQNGGGTTYNDGQYFMAFLGSPSLTGTWELQTGGHHLAIANTYSAGALKGGTPSFRGVEPFAAFTIDGKTNQPLVQERDSLAAMLGSLTTTQLASAKLGTTYNDIVLGPGKDWSFPTSKSGLKCSQLTAAQKAKVLAAIRTYVGDISDDDAAAFMALYTSQIDETYIAYVGNTSVSAKGDYVRIDGPRVWIELSMNGGIVLSAAHPHSIWRDHQTDYAGLGNPNSATNTAQAFTGQFDVFPNPTASSAQVKLGLETAATVSLSLFDAAGKKLSGGFKFNMTAGQHTFPLDVQALPQGNYHCVLEVKNADGQLATATRQLAKI